ncbi:acetyl-CoA carboxylase biotin carboxyl carrier protein [Gemmata sp.]|uniref:acetyl-CoA carboxylase biotin carboxyl carrier protein n=1 Tax=Gemmata sp. TaxID=1914242 RepID=UPI003F71302C
MADDKRDTPRPFDVTTVEYLLKLMTEHDLAEVDLTEGEHRIRLRKGSAIPGRYVAGPPAAYPAPQPAGPAPAAPQPPAAAPQPAAPARNLLEIKSPMVGTYYSRPKPDKPDYVALGSAVRPDTVVCLIEAMKLYNDIKAEVSGKVAEVCVKNGDFVEFNQVLFRVEPG